MNAGSLPSDHWANDSQIGGGRIIGEACHYIDLMRYLADSEITSLSAKCMENSSSQVNEDNSSITIGFKSGSFGTIHYFSNGSKIFPKERIEVFVDGKVLQLDNFITLRGYGWKSFKRMKTWKQDKGQSECVKEFLNSIKSGKPIIPIQQIFEVASKTIDAADMLRSKS